MRRVKGANMIALNGLRLYARHYKTGRGPQLALKAKLAEIRRDILIKKYTEKGIL